LSREQLAARFGVVRQISNSIVEAYLMDCRHRAGDAARLAAVIRERRRMDGNSVQHHGANHGHKPSAIADRYYNVRPLDPLRMWHDKLEAWILEEVGIEFTPEPARHGLQAVSR
jgi:hypothetical protein